MPFLVTLHMKSLNRGRSAAGTDIVSSYSSVSFTLDTPLDQPLAQAAPISYRETARRRQHRARKHARQQVQGSSSDWSLCVVVVWHGDVAACSCLRASLPLHVCIAAGWMPWPHCWSVMCCMSATIHARHHAAAWHTPEMCSMPLQPQPILDAAELSKHAPTKQTSLTGWERADGGQHGCEASQGQRQGSQAGDDAEQQLGRPHTQPAKGPVSVLRQVLSAQSLTQAQGTCSGHQLGAQPAQRACLGLRHDQLGLGTDRVGHILRQHVDALAGPFMSIGLR